MLLILGLDGATLDLIEPWVADGTLPHLGRLMRHGAYGRLASTVPPATFPSWTSFMTGVNPGRHAIFDFSRREPGTYAVRFVNATFRKAPTVWQLLSAAGKRVCVLGLPGTYPPEPVNGCMISGFDTPVTTRADASFVYPRSLAAEVEAHGGFPFADFQEFAIGPDWHRRALGALLSSIENKGRLAERLLNREPWDCFMLLMGETDTAAHHFWAFHDPASPRHRAVEPELQGAIRSVYVAVDRLLGRLQSCAPSAQVLIASDHGFGGAGDTALFLNRWLARAGFLNWQADHGGTALMGRLRQLAVRAIPERWQARCFRLWDGRLAGALETRVRFGGIDWSRTRAFSEELNYFPAVWLNVRGRDPAGQVAAAEYDQTCEALRAALLQWRDPIRGTTVVERVWRRHEAFHGPHTELAPDLILELAHPNGYSYVCLPSLGADGEPVRRLAADELAGGKLRGMSGSHRPDGVVMLAGDGIAAGEVRGAWVGDLAPTMLALCGVPVPADWDGRLLSCVAAAPPSGEPTIYQPPAETPYATGEEACVQERLVQLGYLE